MNETLQELTTRNVNYHILCESTNLDFSETDFVDILSLSLNICISLLCGKQVELRDVDTGNKLNLRFGSEESVESMLLIPQHSQLSVNYISYLKVVLFFGFS